MTDTTADPNAELVDELKANWERFKDVVSRGGELQALVWGDYVDLVTGLLNGRPTWGDTSRMSWRFAYDEGAKLMMGLASLGIGYTGDVMQLVREYEVRLADEFRAAARPDTADAGGKESKKKG
ncbi:hypothetical protein ACFU7T_10680 [Streptomyces sp. NPDC057555]|uniref:hypothetical protein n=1 Tax=Streptomyces sp. NPDC057555 TaxID=3346166 RepID=UPI00368F79DA